MLGLKTALQGRCDGYNTLERHADAAQGLPPGKSQIRLEMKDFREPADIFGVLGS
jgi:hypothetical protein